MNLTITRTALADALDTVGKSVPNRSTLPALACVHMQAYDDALQLHTTNLEASTRYHAECDVDATGNALVPYRLLADLVRSVSASKITLQADGHKLRVAGDGISATINGLDPDEFPVWQDTDDAATLSVSGPEFAQAVRTVQHAASTDESRPTLTNILLKPSDGVLTLAATDGYRLAETSIDCTGEYIDDVLFQASALRPVADRAEGVETLIWRVDENRGVFDCGNVIYDVQRTNAKFPDYKAIVPQKSDLAPVINSKEFAQLVKSALVFKPEANVITLRIDAEQLTVCAQNEGDEYVATMEIESGGELEYRLNARYVLDTLAALPGNTITIGLTQPTRPGLWRGENDRAMCVVMPMHRPR